MKNLVRYDTPTKFVERSGRNRIASTGALDQEYRRRVGLMEHRRFEKSANVLFDREAITRRNDVNSNFMRHFILLTTIGGVIVFVLKL